MTITNGKIQRLSPKVPSCLELLGDSSMADKSEPQRDELTRSLTDLFVNLSSMVKAELQGTGNLLELMEKMNLKVAEEYQNFGDIASGLRVFVEQLKAKNGSFDLYVQQIDSIEQVAEFEAVISMLDKYVRLLEMKARPACQDLPPRTNS